MFRDELFLEEVLTDSAVSVHEELPIVALRIPSCVGATVIPLSLIGLFNGLWTGWSVMKIGWMRVRFPGQYAIRRFILYPADVGGVNSGTVEFTLDGRSEAGPLA